MNGKLSQEFLERVPGYFNELIVRLQQGSITYGDKSLEGNSNETIRELRCEALDIVGWGMILIYKIDKLAEYVTQPKGRA